jgi:hypothetical protein
VITDPSFVLFCALKLLGGTRIIAQLGKTLRIYRSGLVFTWDLIIDQRSEFQSVQCFELISHHESLKILCNSETPAAEFPRSSNFVRI